MSWRGQTARSTSGMQARLLLISLSDYIFIKDDQSIPNLELATYQPQTVSSDYPFQTKIA